MWNNSLFFAIVGVNRARNAPIAQLVEPLSYTQLVLGSSPSGCTK